LCISGNYIFHTYRDSVENSYYLSQDKISDIITLPINEVEGKLTPILACKNRSLRMIEVCVIVDVNYRNYRNRLFSSKNGILLYETEACGAPTTLHLFNNSGGFNGREVLYGTSDGKVGIIEMGVDEPVPKMEHPNEKRLGGVSSLAMYDITNDGVLDFLIARDDGSIQVYSYDPTEELSLKYSFVSAQLVLENKES
jgi:Bardet-Biedl syndrome 7 protein